MKTHFQTRGHAEPEEHEGVRLPDESKRIIHRIGVPVKKQEEYGLDQGDCRLEHGHLGGPGGDRCTVSLEGFVPGPRLVGNPVRMDTIIAGFDPGSGRCGRLPRSSDLDPREVRHIRLAYERKMGRMLPPGDRGERPIHSIRSSPPQNGESWRPPRSTKISPSSKGGDAAGATAFTTNGPLFLFAKDAEGLGRVTLVVGDTASKDYRGGRPVLLSSRIFCAIGSNKRKDGVRIGGCPPSGVLDSSFNQRGGNEK